MLPIEKLSSVNKQPSYVAFHLAPGMGQDGPLSGARRSMTPPVVFAYMNKLLPEINMCIYKWYNSNTSSHDGCYI